MDKSNWIIAGTRNAEDFLSIGSNLLAEGGSSIDAVEHVIRAVESNPLDLSVGYNGFPNLLGDVELDASIMIGSNLKAGAVAGIKNFTHPISIARKILELSPHVLLVGEGADRFAQSVGFEKESLLEPRIQQLYENTMKGKPLLDNFIAPKEIQQIAWRYDKYIEEQLKSFDFKGWYDKLSHKYHGTVNVIALDQNNEMCSGVSTSGLALKFPGRAGDSPIIGAGNYCDREYGAATCVGTGELAIRLHLAGKTVDRMRSMNINDAVQDGIKDVLRLNEKGVIQIIAMDKNGTASACSNSTLHFVQASSEHPETHRINTLNIN